MKFFLKKKTYISNDFTTFLNLDWKFEKDCLCTKNYDRKEDFSVNFPFVDGEVPLAPSQRVYRSQQVWFAYWVHQNVWLYWSHAIYILLVDLQQGYRYHKPLKTLTKFYNRYKDWIQKYIYCCKCRVVLGGLQFMIYHQESHPELAFSLYEHSFTMCPLFACIWVKYIYCN